MDPGDADAVIDDYVRRTQPALTAIRGFCSASLLVNRERGHAAITVSYNNPDAPTRSKSVIHPRLSVRAPRGSAKYKTTDTRDRWRRDGEGHSAFTAQSGVRVCGGSLRFT